MSWQNVRFTHKTYAGIYAKQGRIVSLLAIAGSHNDDVVTRERIRYGVSPNTSPIFLQAFHSALSEGYSFKVFFKHAPNSWEDFGLFNAVSLERATLAGRDVPMLFFTLVRCERDEMRILAKKS
jgi:hypothetical protein